MSDYAQANELPWSEKVPMLSVNPHAASVKDIARMAAELLWIEQAHAALVGEMERESLNYHRYSINAVIHSELSGVFERVSLRLRRILAAHPAPRQVQVRTCGKCAGDLGPGVFHGHAGQRICESCHAETPHAPAPGQVDATGKVERLAAEQGVGPITDEKLEAMLGSFPDMPLAERADVVPAGPLRKMVDDFCHWRQSRECGNRLQRLLDEHGVAAPPEAPAEPSEWPEWAQRREYPKGAE